MGNSENHTEKSWETPQIIQHGQNSRTLSQFMATGEGSPIPFPSMVPSSAANGYPKPPNRYFHSPSDRFLNPIIYQVHPLIYIYIYPHILYYVVIFWWLTSQNIPIAKKSSSNRGRSQHRAAPLWLQFRVMFLQLLAAMWWHSKQQGEHNQLDIVRRSCGYDW